MVGSLVAPLLGGWDATIITFIANKLISIIENAGLMGLPIPGVMIKAIDILKQKAESEVKGKGSG